ncbi:MAG: hypothetical protein ACK5MN_05250 [Lachnospiraceae bacterium]
MNYAYDARRPFVSTSPVKRTNNLSEEARGRRDYIKNHDFKLYVEGGVCKSEVTKKK